MSVLSYLIVFSVVAGTGGAGAAVAPPTKLLAEQLVHPAPPIFSVTYS